MSYKRVTIITGSAVTDEAIAIMKNKYMPAVRAMGCLEADVIQTGPDSTLLIATYANKAAADAAAEKAAALRAESQEGLAPRRDKWKPRGFVSRERLFSVPFGMVRRTVDGRDGDTCAWLGSDAAVAIA